MNNSSLVSISIGNQSLTISLYILWSLYPRYDIQNEHQYIYIKNMHTVFPDWSKSSRPAGFPLDRYIDHVHA